MESLYFIVNPWQVSLPLWVGAVFAKEAILQGMDGGVTWVGNRFLPTIPSRLTKQGSQVRHLGYLDITFLVMNAMVETVFVSHLMHYVWFTPNIDRLPSKLGLLNGPLALYLVVVFNDMFYAPMHRLLHTPLLYKWIHKHHHRMLFPDRGNVDARNEHPVEQILAMMMWYAAIQLAKFCVGMHAVVIPLHLTIMIVGACFNHTGHDLSLNCLGITFSVRAHEMHHRKPNKNYGQLCMWWDKLMNTYTPYIDVVDR